MSCASSFNKRTAKRTINLTELLSDSLKVGIENDKALIQFERFELVNQFEKKYEKYPAWELKNEIENLKNLVRDSIVKENKYRTSLMGWDYELVFHDLLRKGKAKIKNKLSNSIVNQIIYEKYKTKLGGQETYFYFKNRTEFYKIILVLGE